MSKLELRQAAFESSGISYEESLVATELHPSIYDRLGETGLQNLSATFYDKVFADKDKAFQSIFSSSTRNEAVENQYLFFVETFGGPALYKAKKGKYTRRATCQLQNWTRGRRSMGCAYEVGNGRT